MESKPLLKALTFCVIDLETTGGNQKKDKIIEIGLVKIEKLKIIGQKSFLIRPQIDVPDFIYKLTSIRPKDLEKAPLLEEVIEEILEFIDDAILVAHNTSFDLPFLNSELKRMNRPELKNPGLCTNLMTKHLIPGLLNSNLNYMSKIFGIEHQKAHRALDDAKASAQLLLHFLDIFIEKKITKINHLFYPRGKYELDRISVKNKNTRFSIVLGKIQTPYLITFKGEQGLILLALPCQGTQEEMQWIKSIAKTLPWLHFTLQIYGHFLEAFAHFCQYAPKLVAAQRDEVLTFLQAQHTPNAHTYSQQDLDAESADFLIIRHLVPDQFILGPFHMPSWHKSSLVFRYPAHKKKLQQFILSRSPSIYTQRHKSSYGPQRQNKIQNKTEDQRPSLTPLELTLRNFLKSYMIENSSQSTLPKIFPLIRSQISRNMDDYFDELNTFIEQDKRSFNFPKQYL